MPKYYGMYRAKVVDNKDTQKFGRIKIWQPDTMPEINDDKGIWARSANNPIGGRNNEENSENYYAGSSYIPRIGSWIWIFFEAGNPNLPYYFAALDLENTMVLPENQLGTNYEDKWTILKSPAGRCIIISDDSDDERVEITGKKSQMKTPPSGDTDSVYQIDGNQTTILFDERNGKEKVLIRTKSGDFIHIDIDERQLQISFGDDIIIKSGGDIMIESVGDINIKGDNVNIESVSDTNLKAGGNTMIESTGNMNVKGALTNIEAASDVNVKAGGGLNQTCAGNSSTTSSGGIIRRSAAEIYDNSGGGTPAGSSAPAGSSESANPVGERDT